MVFWRVELHVTPLKTAPAGGNYFFIKPCAAKLQKMCYRETPEACYCIYGKCSTVCKIIYCVLSFFVSFLLERISSTHFSSSFSWDMNVTQMLNVRKWKSALETLVNAVNVSQFPFFFMISKNVMQWRHFQLAISSLYNWKTQNCADFLIKLVDYMFTDIDRKHTKRIIFSWTLWACSSSNTVISDTHILIIK